MFWHIPIWESFITFPLHLWAETERRSQALTWHLPVDQECWRSCGNLTNGHEELPIYIWLVVEPTPLKNMCSSVGMMKFPIYGNMESHKIPWFQTTNQ